MKNRPNVSVLINCYNYESYIADAIDSVKSQTCIPSELIIVDDGSTDKSVEIIEDKISDITWAKLIKQKNSGQLAAFEAGFNAASGDIYFLLDADDLYKENHVEQCLDILDEYSECNVLCVKPELLSDDQKCIDFSWSVDSGKIGYRSLFLTAGLGLTKASITGLTSGIVLRAPLVKNNFFTKPSILEDWKTCADDYLLWNLAIAGSCNYLSNIETVLYRIHGENNYSNSSISLEIKKINAAKKVGAIARAKGFILQKIPIQYDCLNRLYREYKANNVYTKSSYRSYLRVLIVSKLSVYYKFKNFIIISIYYIKK